MQTTANLPKLPPAEFWARHSIGHCAACGGAHALLDDLCRDCRLRTITLPDGYNGHTVTLRAAPIRREGDSVLLACAEPGREYLIRWARMSDVLNALAAQS